MNSLIEKRGEWWVPKIDRECFVVILNQVNDLYYIADFCDTKETVIQAGGNLGVWLMAMAQIFKRVITVEPDPVNWECLSRNISPEITAYNIAFGDAHGSAAMDIVQENNVGAHRLKEGEDVQVITIDSLNVQMCL